MEQVNLKKAERRSKRELHLGDRFRWLRAHAKDLFAKDNDGESIERDLATCLSRSAIWILPFALWAAFAQGNIFTLYQVQTQDLIVLLVLPLLFFLLQRRAPLWCVPRRLPSAWHLLTVGGLLAGLLVLGCHVLLWNYPISRDEHMVVFDMAVFEKWRLAAPLAPGWREFAVALVPAFLLNEVAPSGLVSAYLPVNALMRLAVAQVADPAWLNPLLALAGGVALFDIAKRMFGADARAQSVVLLVYALSTQMLANTMTTYAMTGHMAFNLIWLAAFLRGGRGWHAVAIATGLLATGLHQLVFHPLFAAPFVLWRLRQGAWRLAALYGFAYAAILGWWMVFPILASFQTGVAAGGENHASFVERVVPLLTRRDPQTLPLMTLNLLRFVAWQHLALLPLFLAAAPVAWRDRGIAAPMLWGIAAGVAFVALVLPYQGHGWGYRYLHPYLGSFALLAGLGYQRLAAGAPRRTEGMVALLTVLTLVGSMPTLLWHTREFTRPHVALERYIAARDADFVLVDTDPPKTATDGQWAINAVDQVRNDPDLTNRPLRFSSRAMDLRLTAKLCELGSVSVVSRQEMRRLGFGLNVPVLNPRFEQLTLVLEQGGCLVR